MSKGKVKTSGRYVNKKCQSIRMASFTGDRQWERPVWASWNQMTQSEQNQFSSAAWLDSLLHHLPSVDRISLCSLRDLHNEIENKSANILEKFEWKFWVWYHSISSLFFVLSQHIKLYSRQTVWLSCDGYKSLFWNDIGQELPALLLMFLCVVCQHQRFVFLISAVIIQPYSLQPFSFLHHKVWPTLL